MCVSLCIYGHRVLTQILIVATCITRGDTMLAIHKENV